jgi:septum formation protein
MGSGVLILASGSPRRRELLAELGVAFEVVTADVEEVMDPAAMPVRELPAHNAGLKARAVARQQPGRWVLGADTLVVLGERLFGKPPTREAAQEYLATLSGCTHEVITGCCLVAPGGAEELFAVASRVTFRTLAPELIARYLNAVHVLDKAGGYALQQHGEWLVENIEGSRTNILGLPTEELGVRLRSHGLL